MGSEVSLPSCLNEGFFNLFFLYITCMCDGHCHCKYRAIFTHTRSLAKNAVSFVLVYENEILFDLLQTDRVLSYSKGYLSNSPHSSLPQLSLNTRGQTFSHKHPGNYNGGGMLGEILQSLHIWRLLQPSAVPGQGGSSNPPLHQLVCRRQCGALSTL